MTWLAIAWTLTGPVVGLFPTRADCEVAVQYALMQDYVTEVRWCEPVRRGS